MVVSLYAKRTPSEDFGRISSPIEKGMWVDGAELDEKSIDEITDSYSLDSNIVRDVLDRNELPRLEFSRQNQNDSYIFIRLPHLAKSGHITTTPLLCIMKDQRFFTLSASQTIDVNLVASSTIPTSTEDTQSLQLGVIAACTARFEELIAHTSRSIIDTSNRLKTHEVTNQDFIHFVTVEDNLSNCKMNLESMIGVVQRLKENPHEMFNNSNLEALDDIRLHIQQLLTNITSRSQSVESIRNAYSTIANNKLNQRMKLLTVLTVLITLPNVFYGMYGMNVALPFEKEAWAYGAIVGFTILLTMLVYAIAKKLKIF